MILIEIKRASWRNILGINLIVHCKIFLDVVTKQKDNFLPTYRVAQKSKPLSSIIRPI